MLECNLQSNVLITEFLNVFDKLRLTYKVLLADVGAMTRLLHETIAQEREIDKELEVLLGQRQELERKLSSLHKSAEVLLVGADIESHLVLHPLPLSDWDTLYSVCRSHDHCAKISM